MRRALAGHIEIDGLAGRRGQGPAVGLDRSHRCLAQPDTSSVRVVSGDIAPLVVGEEIGNETPARCRLDGGPLLEREVAAGVLTHPQGAAARVVPDEVVARPAGEVPTREAPPIWR